MLQETVIPQKDDTNSGPYGQPSLLHRKFQGLGTGQGNQAGWLKFTAHSPGEESGPERQKALRICRGSSPDPSLQLSNDKGKESPEEITGTNPQNSHTTKERARFRQ